MLLTEPGSETVERMLEEAGHLVDGSAGLYDPANVSVVHHVNQALRANVLYLRDRDYIIRQGEVMLGHSQPERLVRDLDRMMQAA